MFALKLKFCLIVWQEENKLVDLSWMSVWNVWNSDILIFTHSGGCRLQLKIMPSGTSRHHESQSQPTGIKNKFEGCKIKNVCIILGLLQLPMKTNFSQPQIQPAYLKQPKKEIWMIESPYAVVSPPFVKSNMWFSKCIPYDTALLSLFNNDFSPWSSFGLRHEYI